MKTVYLIYRPILGYEESEESHLICSTEKKAKEIVDKCLKIAQDYKSKLKDLDNNLSDEELTPPLNLIGIFSNQLFGRLT